jgi:hypothetical protein
VKKEKSHTATSRENCIFSSPNDVLHKTTISHVAFIKIAAKTCYFYERSVWDVNFAKHVVWAGKSAIFSPLVTTHHQQFHKTLDGSIPSSCVPL